MGAGAAGLMAARILRQSGHQVVVFERNSRVGGRIWTKNDGERWFDPGGEWIDADHELLLGLIREFELELEEAPDAPRRFHFDGEFVNEPVGSAEEKFNAALQEREFGGSLGDFLAHLDGFSELERAWMYGSLRSDEGEELREIEFAGWKAAYLPYLEREGNELSAYRLREGMGALIRRLGEGVEIRNVAVEEVVQSGTRVSMTGEEFDAVIVAVPITSVPSLKFEPGMDLAQAEAWRSGKMSRSVKVCMHFRRPWWEAEGWSGSGLFRSLTQQTWVGTRANAEPTLTAYINGDDAESLHAEPGTAVTRVLADLCAYYPQAATEFERGEFVDWIEIAGGGFSIRPPGFYARALPELRKAHGRVVFAGEHLGNWYGFIEGALESGISAAERVMEWA